MEHFISLCDDQLVNYRHFFENIRVAAFELTDNNIRNFNSTFSVDRDKNNDSQYSINYAVDDEQLLVCPTICIDKQHDGAYTFSNGSTSFLFEDGTVTMEIIENKHLRITVGEHYVVLYLSHSYDPKMYIPYGSFASLLNGIGINELYIKPWGWA